MTPPRLTPLHRQAVDAVDMLAGELVALSHDLHDHPETAFQEHHAAARLSTVLARGGLDVTRGAYGLPTAFAARAGHASAPLVVLCCEYDALPGLGHACGHNVIAAASAGAGLALRGLADAAGGRLTVLGTPAEEGGGGKILLAHSGAFDGAVAALLAHPSSYETVEPRITAASTLDALVLGRAAHASMFPERGINALDGLVLGYLGVAALRQHLAASDKVHGIVTEGGAAPNVVPARARGRFMVRAGNRDQLRDVERRVVACLHGGAEAAGARLDVRRVGPIYAELRPNPPLAATVQTYLRWLGRHPVPGSEIPLSRAASTDLGNVSQLVPAVHPKLAISPADVVQHSAGFEHYAVGPAADRAVVDAAKMLALVTLDLWLRPDLRGAVAAAFRNGLTRQVRRPEEPGVPAAPAHSARRLAATGAPVR